MHTTNDNHVDFLSLEQDTEEWLEWRQKGIGSSDIALLMHPEKLFDRDIFTLWKDRTGVEIREFLANEHTLRGKALEPKIRDKVNKMLKSEYEPWCVIRNDAPYLRASLDGYDWTTNSILEIKAPSERVHAEYMSSWDIPRHYYYQMQYQMLVCGADYGWFSFYGEADKHPNLIYVPANFEVQADIEKRCRLVWTAVENKVPIGFSGNDIRLFHENPIMVFVIGEYNGELPLPLKKKVGSYSGSFVFCPNHPSKVQKMLDRNREHTPKFIYNNASRSPFHPGNEESDWLTKISN